MRYSREWGFQFRITPAVKYLILVNVGIFIIDLISGLLFKIKISSLLGLRPALFWSGAIWQPVTYIFLHAGIFHILINMLILWMFGTSLESTWGSHRFIKFFFICGIGAGILSAAVTPGDTVPTIGASGAIYGLLMAFGILFPNQLIYIWGIFPVKAKYFVIGIGAIELLTAISTSQTGIAHFAHLGGMLFGLVYMKWDNWRQAIPYWRTQKRHQKHLKVVKARTEEKETLRKDVDLLLDKINKKGMNSLTADERQLFKDLSQRMKDLDKGV
ncbi:MAG: rhomboid family intramembrane serine protease [Thermodesulfovibrionales bacterium]